MNKGKNILEYNKEGNIVLMFISELNMTYSYFYELGKRIYIIKFPKISSNNKTVIFEKLNNGEYLMEKKIEYGDVYKTIIFYNNKGIEFKIERFNKIKNTKYSKETYKNSKGDSLIWFEEYNNVKNIGFKVNLDILKRKFTIS